MAEFGCELVPRMTLNYRRKELRTGKLMDLKKRLEKARRPDQVPLTQVESKKSYDC